MMTDTELQVEELGGCYPTLPNHVSGKLIDTCMRDIPQVPWTQEEIDYVKKINATNPDYVQECIDKYGDFDKAPQLHTGVMDIDTADDYGSTDVGDVGHITPTCSIRLRAMVSQLPVTAGRLLRVSVTPLGRRE